MRNSPYSKRFSREMLVFMRFFSKRMPSDAKEDFSEEDGHLAAAELEAEFAEMNGWEAETEAGKLLQGLGLDNMLLYSQISSLTEAEKVKVLLARALFGDPDIILLDEPTNGLDIKSINWLENFLYGLFGHRDCGIS